MGMYDDLVFADPIGAPKCHAGHPVTEFQTKGLDCNLGRYWVIDSQLFHVVKDDADAVIEMHDGGYVQVYRSPLEKVTPTDYVQVSGCCPRCAPVVPRRRPESFFKDAGEYPWCEYRIHFVAGQVRAIEPVLLESREEIIRRIRANGGEVVEKP